MRILAVETTGLAGSVAALDGKQVLAAFDLDESMRSAQSLAPGIVSVLDAASWRSGDVELVAVATGPGSFTGLRVGVATAKMFAYAVGASVLGVNTLEAIAAQAVVESSTLWTVLDAQREQVFAGKFVRESAGIWQWRQPTQLLDNSDWLAQLESGQAVSGPGLEKIADRLPHNVIVVDRRLWQPKAQAVGQLAWRAYQSGRRDDLFSLLPQYFRISAAEEKRSGQTPSPRPSPKGRGSGF
jgi:tRNA threonylcarbamoyladenosine biosynthesis protein TsaB